jgi:UDP-N-acetyl-D-glucosamine dehydrogenase
MWWTGSRKPSTGRPGAGIKGARVLLLGIAYKKNVDDIRESPSLKLIELLEARGAAVDYSDPFVPVIPQTREHAALAGRVSMPLDAASLAGYDAVLIATDHDGIRYDEVARSSKLVVDTRGVCRQHGLTGSNIVRA